MFAKVLDTSLGYIDENSSCKKLSLFQAVCLLQTTFSINLQVRICLFTRAKLEGKLFSQRFRKSTYSYFQNILKGYCKSKRVIGGVILIELNEKFSFKPVPDNLVREIILSLDGSTATPVGDIPAYMLKSMVDIHLPFTTKIINFSFENGRLLGELKLAEVSRILKKNDDLDAKKLQACQYFISMSNVFERITYIQIDTCMRKLLTGFRKNHSTQHCLMSMLGMRKNISDK